MRMSNDMLIMVQLFITFADYSFVALLSYYITNLNKDIENFERGTYETLVSLSLINVSNMVTHTFNYYLCWKFGS